MRDANIHLIVKIYKSLIWGHKKTIGAVRLWAVPIDVVAKNSRGRLDELLEAVLGSLVEFFLDADELVVLRHAVGA